MSRRIGPLLPGEEAGEPKPFHPHLTIARVKTESRLVTWPALLAEASVEDVGSRVTHVTLYRSRGLPGAADESKIRGWPPRCSATCWALCRWAS